MTDITVIKVTDLGDDVLQVEGTIDGEAVSATGWVSAMTNYFSPESYTDDGHLAEWATAREMTSPEKLAYWKSVLLEQAPIQAPVETVLFQA